MGSSLIWQLVNHYAIVAVIDYILIGIVEDVNIATRIMLYIVIMARGSVTIAGCNSMH
jgi:hypothetical protein